MALSSVGLVSVQAAQNGEQQAGSAKTEKSEKSQCACPEDNKQSSGAEDEQGQQADDEWTTGKGVAGEGEPRESTEHGNVQRDHREHSGPMPSVQARPTDRRRADEWMRGRESERAGGKSNG
ncbi:uncharacterized protein B0H18DRAFT_1129641 [Fomitopsis serialis]|uniref:uncharacterized protein n=1 Tax=Fomitopsis serialis TaxID=139415 RepID=UPI002007F295|nr:uncharacterized protein B0H18DRAFT_1129641 [Neoantrodia serialis]KAH9910715.1 hypothetical protein B0H18DRAFT_1129641 [Neoantrodia serialis]